MIGFTAVALIGRFADPVRPYLIAKKTGEPLGSQIAVYIVERLFDFGSMALIFSLALLWIPQSAMAATPGHAGFFSHLFAPLIERFPILSVVLRPLWSAARHAGRRSGFLLLCVCRATQWPASLSPPLALFQEHGPRSRPQDQDLSRGPRRDSHPLRLRHFCVTLAQHVGIIAFAYLETVHAFTASPALAGMSFSTCVMLMMISGSVSVLQLPVLGWFSQIAFVAAALSACLAQRRKPQPPARLRFCSEHFSASFLRD